MSGGLPTRLSLASKPGPICDRRLTALALDGWGQNAVDRQVSDPDDANRASARDLASRNIRVNTIAPGVMDTPMLGRLRDDIRQGLAAAVPHPKRLGRADDYARLAMELLTNPYLNGETIRLDGAIRMPPR